MKKCIGYFMLAVLALGISACQKEATSSTQESTTISDQTLASIKRLGFRTSGVIKLPEGYLVENDIILTDANLLEMPMGQKLMVGKEEQYHTYNLVTVPRNITIQLDRKMGTLYQQALDAAIARYNALGLRITMSRVSRKSDIYIKPAPSWVPFLASGGFPTATGAPYNTIMVNTSYLNSNQWNLASITSILAHEIGHCIGFRHTDYMDRSYSCGGTTDTENADPNGALHIPGTPVPADPNSWMLACIGKDVDRPFNPNDIIALNYLY